MRPRPDSARAGRNRRWHLRLYVAGLTPRSLTAIDNLRRICGEHLAGRHHVEIVDLLERPELAAAEQILAIPTLVRVRPQPMLRLVGDLSSTEHVLNGLQLRSTPASLRRVVADR